MQCCAYCVDIQLCSCIRRLRAARLGIYTLAGMCGSLPADVKMSHIVVSCVCAELASTVMIFVLTMTLSQRAESLCSFWCTCCCVITQLIAHVYLKVPSRHRSSKSSSYHPPPALLLPLRWPLSSVSGRSVPCYDIGVLFQLSCTLVCSMSAQQQMASTYPLFQVIYTIVNMHSSSYCN